jgi:hypothetical protein
MDLPRSTGHSSKLSIETRSLIDTKSWLEGRKAGIQVRPLLEAAFRPVYRRNSNQKSSL